MLIIIFIICIIIIFILFNLLLFHKKKKIKTLLKQFPNNDKLKNMRENIKEFQKRRWEDNWNENVLPLLKQ